MHIGRLNSARYQRAIAKLAEAGERGLSGLLWTMNPGTMKSELNKAFAKAGDKRRVHNDYVGMTKDGSKIWRYWIGEIA